MGAFRFERQPPIARSNKNVIEFDSSAELAIGRAFGYDPKTIELRETSRTDAQVNFDVYAAEFSADDAPPKPLLRRGILKTITRQEMRRRQDGNLHFVTQFA